MGIVSASARLGLTVVHRCPAARSSRRDAGWATLIMPLLAAAVVSLVVLGGCTGGGEPQASPDDQAERLQVGMASTDLAIGDNRVAFGLLRLGSGPVRDAEVRVETFLIRDGVPDGPRATADAEFREWPGGTAGVYVANIGFDQPGEWGLRMRANLAGAEALEGSTRVTVKQVSSTPPVGAFAPRSVNRTVTNVERLTDLTTDTDPDPDLYRQTVAEALEQKTPLLVSFATPAYCRTATCGPQLSVIKSLKSEFDNRINVLHVEVYDNPPEIREQGIDVARLAPAIAEWGLPSEPWTFVVDSDGVVNAKFEGFVGAEELREAIETMLADGP